MNSCLDDKRLLELPRSTFSYMLPLLMFVQAIYAQRYNLLPIKQFSGAFRRLWSTCCLKKLSFRNEWSLVISPTAAFEAKMTTATSTIKPSIHLLYAQRETYVSYQALLPSPPTCRPICLMKGEQRRKCCSLQVVRWPEGNQSYIKQRSNRCNTRQRMVY